MILPSFHGRRDAAGASAAAEALTASGAPAAVEASAAADAPVSADVGPAGGASVGVEGGAALEGRGTQGAPVATEGGAAIMTRGLTKTFGGRTVVEGLDLTVHAGEVYGFLGPNGAGKTTTLRLLLGLLDPDVGSASVLGFDSRRQGPALRRSVGYVSQLRSLYLDLTVEQNLLFFGRMYGLGEERLAERVAAEVERFQLEEGLRRQLGQQPTGVQRRCSLAVALLHEPRLLILDEPTSGMDTTGRREFWAFLGGLAARETTVVLTTHHLEEAQVCDRLCLMLGGRLHFEGSPQGMIEAFPNPVLLVSTSRLQEAHQVLKNELGATLLGNRIRVQRAGIEPQCVLGLLKRAGIEEAQIESVKPTLEDAFVRAAGDPGVVSKNGGADD